MRRARACALLVAVGFSGALATSCNGDEPAEKPKQVKKGVDTKRIPVPDHTPEKMSDPGKPRKVTTTGVMDVDLSGQRQHFRHFPKGVNAATYAEDTGAAALTITGRTADDGSSLQLSMSGVRLDKVELPKTFKTTDKGDTSLTARFQIDTMKSWSAKTGGGEQQLVEVTLESYEGRTVKGTFSGTLEPRTPDLGKPVELKNGKFEVELRLKGVAEGDKAAEKPS